MQAIYKLITTTQNKIKTLTSQTGQHSLTFSQEPKFTNNRNEHPEVNLLKQDFEFFKTTMPDSRKADYYLGCLDGCVFLDFNYTTDKRINLCRISFDGYGCCNLDNETKCLDNKSSNTFLDEISKDILDQEIITKIVLEIIRLNKDKIWTVALEEYNLIDKL
jgi:hypothetical protein